MKKKKPVLAFNLQSVATKVVYLISCFRNCTIFGISAKMNINLFILVSINELHEESIVPISAFQQSLKFIDRL